MKDDPREQLFECLEAAVAEGVFPGCVALVWRAGATLYHEAHGALATHPASTVAHVSCARDTVYDLASLTKVLATTTLTSIAVSEGRVGLDSPVPAPWSQACPGARLGDLLSHSAGLRAHREFFAALGRRSAAGQEAILAAVCATAPSYAAGTQAIYSDLGFMILGAWLERLFDAPLERVFADRVAWPLGLDGGEVPRLGFHRLMGGRGPTPAQMGRVAPTEVYDPALHPGGAPSYFPIREGLAVAHYEAHDDNCFAMGGVAGHAGLFGDAQAAASVCIAWLEGQIDGLDAARFWRRSAVAGSTRMLGWDSASADGATGGALSERAPGHLGFTGTSAWIEPTPGDPRVFVLLSNRVHPTRTSTAITRLRPRFHALAARL